jgi:hypothetical protein
VQCDKIYSNSTVSTPNGVIPACHRPDDNKKTHLTLQALKQVIHTNTVAAQNMVGISGNILEKA